MLKQKMTEEKTLKIEVEKNIKYQEYLESVSNNMAKFFPEISDILNRYNNLQGTNVDLIHKARSADNSSDQLRRDYLLFRKERENKELTDNNVISDLQSNFDKAKQKTNIVQGEIEIGTKEVCDKTLQLGQMISSITNLLERCEQSFRWRHNKPPIDRSEDLSDNIDLSEKCNRAVLKLEEICMFINDYQDIRDNYFQELKKN